MKLLWASVARRVGAWMAVVMLAAMVSACGAGPRPTTTPTRGAAVPAASAAGSAAAASRKTYTAPPPMTIDQNKSYTAAIKTSLGNITVALNAKDAPLTVNNFVFLAREGFYNGTTFHRVIKDFMIQGGDPKGDGTGGPGYKFADEPVKGKYEIGSVAMANSGPNTNGSQFFICEGPNCTVLPAQYNLFGKVTEGQDVVSKIAAVPTGTNDRPLQPVVITSITIEEK